VQTVRCLAATRATNAIEKTDAVIAAAKHAARQGVLVVALSEMNKSAYRGGNDQMNDLASNKGSSSIEYGVDLMIALRADPDVQGMVDAKIVKSRIGKNNITIKLQLDLDRADVSEHGSAKDTHLEAIRRVLDTVARLDCKSRNEVLRHTVVRRDHGLQALTALIHEGRLKLVDGFIREVLPPGVIAN
jgi:hypothetical protein